MPGAGTHTTIIQHLAMESAFTAFLGDPTKNTDWANYSSTEGLQSRYSILGAMGPDIFYAMLDYGGNIQEFENIMIQIVGTFECAGELSSQINNLINSGLNSLTLNVWDQIQLTFKTLVGILESEVFDKIVDKHNFWSIFLPLRQVDDYEQNWYWADFLHYAKTGCFAQKLLEMSKTYSSDPTTTSFLKAYSLGYLTHYVADTVGHAYVNRIVESPWRNNWQRHHLVENFIDAYVWDHWHNGQKYVTNVPLSSADEQPLDNIVSQTTADGPPRAHNLAAPLHYARLNDFCNIGAHGLDPALDEEIKKVCDAIKQGLSTIGLSGSGALQSADDPAFVTWTNFMADAIWATYPPSSTHPTKLSTGRLSLLCPDPGGYPSADDIAGAYGAYRLVLSVATEDDVDAPVFPNIVGDISAVLTQIWTNIQSALGSIPPPPSLPSGGSFDPSSIWNAAKAYAKWLGQVAIAVLKVVGDLIAGGFLLDHTVDAEEAKVALWALNSILFALYHSVRMPLVMSGYSIPLTEDLTGNWGQLSLQTLWKTMGGEVPPPYPVEPMVSERDFASDPSHVNSPYRPYFRPSVTAPTNFEMPLTIHPEQLMLWKTPDDMLEKPIGTDVLLSANGPAPPTTVPVPNPASINTAVLPPLAELETFDGSMRYFGGIFANCEVALTAAVAYLWGLFRHLP